jgi:hypothetical protein
MSTGTYFHEVCYPSQADALNAACSAVNDVSADGSSVTCTSVAAGASASVGGAFTGTLNVQLVNAQGAVSAATRSVSVQDCERYDITYWGPVVSLWFTALVVIIVAKVLHTRVFTRETL